MGKKQLTVDGGQLAVVERPILFSGEMVRAILDGKKTQTRRVMNPQPEKVGGGWIYDGKYFVSDEDMQSHLFHDVYGGKGSPYGAVYGDGSADRLWVRETFDIRYYANPEFTQQVKVLYAADHSTLIRRATKDVKISPHGQHRWRPSIFMPRFASRITLEVVNVRVERVQDISHEDAVAEGCYEKPGKTWGRLGYSQLWEKINLGRGFGWDVNPWVWVVEFRRM